MEVKRKIFGNIIVIFCALSALVLAQNVSAQEPVFTGTFEGWALTIDVPDVGPILGTTDLEVRHPFWVSARPAEAAPRDPTDPAKIAEAWTTDTFTNMRDLNGEAVIGATLHQEWVGVSIEEANSLFATGYAVIGSSGGFMFALIKQTASPEATAAFGLRTIDNGEFIRAEDTAQGVCG